MSKSKFMKIRVELAVHIWMSFLLLNFAVDNATADKQCIQSSIESSCTEDTDCYQYDERHLFCNKTHGVNICAFQIETYAGQAEVDKDCPGEEFSAETWSNPISDDVLDGSRGIDCMRWCYFTETCFAVTVVDHKCYLKNDKCFTNLKPSPGALLGVMSVVREDYHCGCHYPFTRRRSNGELLSWTPDCPESQLDRSPYRCCSEKGLCVKCTPGQSPPRPRFTDLGTTPSQSDGQDTQNQKWYSA